MTWTDMDPAEEDWEPYKQAALFRSEEREREAQEEELETENLLFYTNDLYTHIWFI